MTALSVLCSATWPRTWLPGALLLAAAMSGCGGGSSDSSRASGAGAATAVRSLVASYVQAVDRHDGSALCGMFDSTVASHFERTGSRRFTCGRLLRAFIGYVEDSGQPEWKGVSLNAPASVSLSGRWAVATFYVTHRIDYTAGAKTPLVEADTLPLVLDGGRWRLASSGRTLAIASGLLFDDPRAVASGWKAMSSPGQVAREYVTSLSGAAPGICDLLGHPPGSGGGCWTPVTVDKILPKPGKPAWQAAQIDGIRTQVSGNSAEVTLALTETYLSPGGTLFTRPLSDQLSEQLTPAGWRPSGPSLLYFHARGLRAPPRPTPASVLPAGRLLASDGALGVWGGGHGAALFTQSQSGDTASLKFVLFSDGNIVSTRTLASVNQHHQSDFAGAGTAAAGDLGHGRALVAWSAFSVYTGVHVQLIGASGQPLAPVRSYGVPHYTSPSEPYNQAVPGSDREATAPRLSFNPRLHRYLLVWNVGQATEQRGIALVLNEQALPVAAPTPINGLSYASVVPTADGWLATSTTPTTAPLVVALDGTGRVLSRRILQGGVEAVLASAGGSDLIAWSTTSHTFRGPEFVRTRRLTPRGQPSGPVSAVATLTGSTKYPAGLIPVQVTGMRRGYILGWQAESRDSFSYSRLSVDGKPTSSTNTYKIHNTAGFQPAQLLAPYLTLTPDGNDAWLWLLGETTARDARVVGIR